MKIRSDFVTNSSSVSYILTMKEDLANIMKDWYTIKGSEEAIVYEKLRNMIRKGEKLVIDGETFYKERITFHTNYIITSDVDNFDFKKLSDDDLLAYIYGEYILRGKISQLGVFGATLREHF